MKYKVDGWNNFCRVFELPQNYPSDYCFGGGHSVNFQLVDWFNPVSGLSRPAVSKEVWEKEVGLIETKEVSHEELKASLIPFLHKKIYVRDGCCYLVLCDFTAAIMFAAKKGGDKPNP